MQVGEVRIAEDADFSRIKEMCTCHDGWKQEYGPKNKDSKNNTTAWTKANDVSDFKLIKVYSYWSPPCFHKCPANT